MRNAFYFIIIATLCFSFFACQKEPLMENSDGTITLEDAGSLSSLLETQSQTWHQTNKRLCILYGYGYNNKEFIDEMNSLLFEKFGKAEDGGLVQSFTFPDDFKRGTRVYITNLADMLSDLDVQGLILLGAPEGTHIAIARIQDSWGGSLPFPVFSIFPQDDVLGIEDSSDFVLDKAQKAEINGIITEEEQSFVQDVPMILENCASYITYSSSPIEKNARLYEVVRRICRDLKVERYSDPDTGLISINHFVLE